MSPSKTNRFSTHALTAYAISSIAAAATALGAVQRIVYTREEGRSIERRVTQMEHEYREDMRQIRRSLELIWVSVSEENGKRIGSSRIGK